MRHARRLPPILSWLFPQPDEPGKNIVRRLQVVLFVSLTIANGIGAIVVFCFANWALPLPDVDDQSETTLVNLAVLGVVMVGGVVVGTIATQRRFRRVREWLRSDTEPSEKQRYDVLRAPFRTAVVHAVLWTLAAIIFGVLNLVLYDAELGQRVALTVLLGGVTTTAIAYLVTERAMRPAAARALSERPPEKPVRPGVRGRALLAWAVGTGVPVLGLILVGLSTLTQKDFTATELAITILALGGIALFAGLYVQVLATRAVADPIESVREGMSEIEAGELEVEIPVYDGTEVGLLQAGFNRMAAGLRERARLEDLFGRHVGEDVARAALEGGIELGGEVREVAVLFTDVVGSTKLAADLEPQEVVERLNSFFGVVIEVIDEHEGSVNKFEGDAVLAIFGAPDRLDDPAGRALAAARELAERLPRQVEGLEAGIGVSAGEAVAGNIGGESRFEYTVIGDPVNEASRLTELAKDDDGQVLASEAAIEAASDAEARNWEVGEAVELRGRERETRLARPR